MTKVKGTPNYEALRKSYHVPKNARWFSVNGQYFSRDGKPPKNITGGYTSFGHQHHRHLGHCHPLGGSFATLGQGIGNFGFSGGLNLASNFIGGGFNLASNFVGGGCQTILPATMSCVDPCAINTGSVCSTTTTSVPTTTTFSSPVLLAGGGASASASAAASGFGASASASAAASGFGASASASAAASGFGASASAAASAGGFRLV